MKDKVMDTGLIGTAIAAVCYFTPALVIVLGVLGLTLYTFVIRNRRRPQ